MEDKPTILIVDDESGSREALKMILHPHYHVEEAEGGLQALQIIRKKKIDVVTLDLRMPGMDGLAVLRAIKTYDSQIEVLIITGYGTIKNAIELVRLGACVYLTKPFHISEVTHEIILAIEKRGRIDRLNRQFIG
ncbi:MAG: response regulator (plasmid) [Candidatus Manganitrophus sp.]|nr:response regulator [Candidatus Manganitrophus sp.]